MRIPLAMLIAFCAVSTAWSGAVRGEQQRSTIPPLPALTELTSPAGPGSAQPNLFADARGRVWMTWLEPRPEGGRRLRLASLSGTTWSTPTTVAEGPTLLANWADFPSVFVTTRGLIAVHWLETGTGRGAYGVRLVTSVDGGQSWTPVVTPHRDTSATEHGFVSMFETPEGSLGLIWLDGREMAAHGGGHGAGGASMTLRATTMSNGKLGEDALIDPRVCDCCQTSAVQTRDGVAVVYRDRSPEEIRDTSIVRYRGGRWSAPEPVFADGWKITGCPVNGPVVTSAGDAVAVAWFTAATGTSRTFVSFSSGARPFGAPIRVDRDLTIGRIGMVMPSAERVIVSSVERPAGAETARLLIRDVRSDGQVSDPVGVGMSADRSSGFARLALSNRRLVVAWTEVAAGAPTRVHVATTDLR